MLMKVHCTHCHAPLKVPETASGKRARCPNCQHVFTVPAPAELVDETISSWIESDVEQEQDRRTESWMQKSGLDLSNPAKARHVKPGDKRRGTGGLYKTSLSSSIPGGAPLRPASQPMSPPSAPQARETPPVPRPLDSNAETADLGAPDGMPPDSVEADSEATAVVDVPAEAVEPRTAEPTITPYSFRVESSDGAPTFAQDLHVKGLMPHLVVRECSQSGIRLAFDSIFLEHEGFRASMPVRGVFSGKTERDELVARPLAFTDRSGAAIRSASELETRYEQPLMPGWSAHDLLNAMGIIESLPRPFNYPMPYYVSRNHTHLSLACSTRKRIDGGITCEVVIPGGDYALDWLRNVNGICGPECGMLEHELALIQADSWAAMPEVCRQRIAVWCRFKPRERFVGFLGDADFGQRDLGLAGLVFTNQRLIWHKYHHNGETALEPDAVVLCRKSDDFVNLALQTREQRLKLVKLYAKDLPRLTEILKEIAPTIQVIKSDEA